MHDCIGLCLSYLLLFLQHTCAHCLLIMTALIYFLMHAWAYVIPPMYRAGVCMLTVDYGTAVWRASALCCCCLPCTHTHWMLVIMAHVNRLVATLGPYVSPSIFASILALFTNHLMQRVCVYRYISSTLCCNARAPMVQLARTSVQH